MVIAFEYRAPVGGRVDCMLFGKSQGMNNVVLFELKGWARASLSYNNTLIKTYTGGTTKDVEHPSVQAERYFQHFTNYIELLNTQEYHLTGLAYCYNYVKNNDDDALYHPNFAEARERCPLYIKEDQSRLAELLHSLLENGEGMDVFNNITSWHPTPTKRLIQAAADIIIDKDNFYLLGDQNVAFTKFESILKDCLEKDEKSVIVIKGGPGTGKTIIALKMLSAVAREGKTPMFTTRSKALKDELIRALRGVKTENRDDASDLIADIFKFRPSQYEENELDVLIIDEAHRTKEKANDQTDGNYTVEVEHEGEGSVHSPLSQIMSLIYCAKVTVFFIDDHQAVKSEEIGMSGKIVDKAKNYQKEIEKEIKKFKKEQQKREDQYPEQRQRLDREKEQLDRNENNLSKEDLRQRRIEWDKSSRKLEREKKWGYGLQNVRVRYEKEVIVLEEELTTQFRCIGGDKFVSWLDEVLYKRPDEIRLKLRESDFDFRIFNNPNELYELIRELDHPEKKETARLCAGWCWKWKQEKTEPNGDLLHEVTIPEFEFSLPWETHKNGHKPTGDYKDKYAPNTNSWASDSRGINQIGCIYTAQGFEFEYVGVIIGPDLIYDEENDCLKCVAKENKEIQVTDKNADILVRNIYRVLMSRGKYGCYIFCCDPEVANYLKRFMI